MQLHSQMVKPGYGGVLNQAQHARNHRADGLNGGREDAGGGGKDGADGGFKRKLDADGARNNVAKNEPQKWNSNVEFSGGGGGGATGGGGAAENIGAVQQNWGAADALARAISGGCAAKLAADCEAVQEDAGALGWARGGGEEEGGEEKGGGVVAGHLSRF